MKKLAVVFLMGYLMIMTSCDALKVMQFHKQIHPGEIILRDGTSIEANINMPTEKGNLRGTRKSDNTPFEYSLKEVKKIQGLAGIDP